MKRPRDKRKTLEIVPATYTSDRVETRQYSIETGERTKIVNSLNSATLRNEVNPAYDDPVIYGARDAFILFRFRIAGANLSIPNIIMHLWELFIIVILMFSLINVWIPTSPYFWVPLSIWIATIVYFILLLICVLTLPSPAVSYTWSRARSAKYQRNDALHLWWGVLLHFFVSIFYLIWYVGPAAAVLPIDPLTNLVTYLGQRALHIILVAGCMAILFTRPFANNIGLTGVVLFRIKPPKTAAEFDEIEYDEDDESEVYDYTQAMENAQQQQQYAQPMQAASAQKNRNGVTDMYYNQHHNHNTGSKRGNNKQLFGSVPYVNSQY